MEVIGAGSGVGATEGLESEPPPPPQAVIASKLEASTEIQTSLFTFYRP